MPRQLHVIAGEIIKTMRSERPDWQQRYYSAVPYIKALTQLETVDQDYGFESADMIIRYLLGNLQTWRGETARRIKAELKEIINA